MSDNHQPSSPEGFFYQPKTIQWILRIFYSLCIILVIVDFIIHRHTETSVEKIPAFYALYGFISCVILVLIANQMRKWVMRDEHYYELEDQKITVGESTDDNAPESEFSANNVARHGSTVKGKSDHE